MTYNILTFELYILIYNFNIRVIIKLIINYSLTLLRL